MAKKKIAIIHTTPATIASLKDMILEAIPDVEVINFLDDSILPELIENDGNIKDVEKRIVQYGKFAEEAGADLILSACSSVGDLADSIQEAVSVPVVRIDDAMAGEAIRRGRRIGVAATLSTTLNPTINLLKSKAESNNKEVEFITLLAEEAYRKLLKGNVKEHDRILADELLKLEKETDVVVLAQASMSRAVNALPPSIDKNKFITSPPLAIQTIKNMLHGAGNGSGGQVS